MIELQKSVPNAQRVKTGMTRTTVYISKYFKQDRIFCVAKIQKKNFGVKEGLPGWLLFKLMLRPEIKNNK